MRPRVEGPEVAGDGPSDRDMTRNRRNLTGRSNINPDRQAKSRLSAALKSDKEISMPTGHLPHEAGGPGGRGPSPVLPACRPAM
jgi:hypothetical protein